MWVEGMLSSVESEAPDYSTFRDINLKRCLQLDTRRWFMQIFDRRALFDILITWSVLILKFSTEFQRRWARKAEQFIYRGFYYRSRRQRQQKKKINQRPIIDKCDAGKASATTTQRPCGSTIHSNPSEQQRASRKTCQSIIILKLFAKYVTSDPVDFNRQLLGILQT